MSLLWVNPAIEERLAALGLISYDSFTSHFLSKPLPPRTGVRVTRHTLAGPTPLDVFFKLYYYRTPRWDFVARASKARREYQSYLELARLGIPTPMPVACAEQRDAWGRLRGALIVTSAVPQAVTLEDWLANPGSRKTSMQRRGILHALARQVRAAHNGGFAHRDLMGRNVLVDGRAEGETAPVWIDCPRGRRVLRWLPGRHFGIKDLAALDKTGVRHGSRSERLRFALAYLGKGRLDAEAKSFIRAVRRYAMRRWPEDF